MHPKSNDETLPAAATTHAGGAGQIASSGKRAWSTPSMEEVPFTRTEAGGVGGVYDMAVYSGSR